MSYLFHRAVFCVSILLLVTACKHKKPAVSKGKVQKQVAVKPSGKPAAKPREISEPSENVTGAKILRDKLELSDREIRDSKLYTFISDWYGVPYKYGGCQKTGVDCSCFTSLLCDKVYNHKVARSASDMYKECDKITLEEVREGDLLFFKIGGNTISHVGVYLRNTLFVHSSTSKGVIISSMEEAYYKKYFHAGGRFKAL